MDASRRDVFKMTLGGAVAAASLNEQAGAQTQQQPAPPSPNPLDLEPSLREAGRRSGIAFGLCEAASSFVSQKPYFQRMFDECNIFSPGNQFAWKAVERTPGIYWDADLRAATQAAVARDVGVIGHTLLWYYTIPDWVRALEPDAIARAADDYVAHMVDAFRESVVRWDVINEQVYIPTKRDEGPNKRDDGLRNSFLLEKLGPGYMKRAFEVARRTNPKVSLCYNEFGIEYRNDNDRAKREALLKLLRGFRDDNTQVDVVGLQSHLDAGKQLDLEGLSRFVAEVKGLGYQVALTELDVVDTSLPADETERDARVAKHVDDYLSCICAQVKPTTITCWGFADNKTWLTMWNKRADGLPLRPLPYDKNLSRKPLWSTIRKFLV